MKTQTSVALAGLIFVAMAADASAQAVRRAPPAAFYGLTTGRSAYVAPRGDADADQIVMGLRVPHGPRTLEPVPSR